MFQYFEWNHPADGSLWRHLAKRATEIKNFGTAAVSGFLGSTGSL